MDAASVRDGNIYNLRDAPQVSADCQDARDGVGKDGDFMIDFHPRFSWPTPCACKLIEEYEPFLVEDPVRSDSFLEDIPKLRR